MPKLLIIGKIFWIKAQIADSKQNRHELQISLFNSSLHRPVLINKQRSLGCALFCYKARRKRLEHERSVGRNTRRSSSRFLSAKASLFVL